MEIPKDFQIEIAINQNELKNAIRNHQILVWKLKEDPNNEDIKTEIQEVYREIVSIGENQKLIVDRLRKTLVCNEQNGKNTVRSGLEERRFNLSNVLQKTRKQTIVPRSTSLSSLSQSDESLDGPSEESPVSESIDDDSPEPITQVEFLSIFGLCTPEVFKELQNKRVERKRRSTANPHFLYGNSWDHNKLKRKKNIYLQSNFSPPNTRSAVALRKQREDRRIPSPPSKSDSRSTSPVPIKKSHSSTSNFNIPNLPSGLTIERVDSNSSSPDVKVCVICRLPGGLSLCEKCDSNYHISCHNRPLNQSPRFCPKCAPKRENDSSNTRDPVSMTVTKEKFIEKKMLQEKNTTLNKEFNTLKARHAELTISLKSQEQTKKELMVCEKSTKENIKRILDFVNSIKGTTATCEPVEAS